MIAGPSSAALPNIAISLRKVAMAAACSCHEGLSATSRDATALPLPLSFDLQTWLDRQVLRLRLRASDPCVRWCHMAVSACMWPQSAPQHHRDKASVSSM